MANESELPQGQRQMGPLMRVLRDFGGGADEGPAVNAGDEVAVLQERVTLTSAAASGAGAGVGAGGGGQTQMQSLQQLQVRTRDGRDVALPVDLLFPASGRLEEHVGYQQWSMRDAHLQLLALPASAAGCYLVVKSERGGDGREAVGGATGGVTGGTSAALGYGLHYHLAILDHNGEKNVLREYEMTLEQNTYKAKNFSSQDFPGLLSALLEAEPLTSSSAVVEPLVIFPFGGRAAEAEGGPSEAEAVSAGAEANEGERVMRVQYTYNGEAEGHVGAQESEQVTLVDASALERGWLLVRTAAGKTGYFPADWLLGAPDSPQSDASYAHVSREQAERMLLYPGAALGTYIVRPRRAQYNSFAISVLAPAQEPNPPLTPRVYHFIIERHAALGHYFVADFVQPTFRDLIDSFKRHSYLGALLTDPSDRIAHVPERPPHAHEPVSRDQLVLKDVLSEDRFGLTHAGSLLFSPYRTSSTTTTSSASSSPSDAETDVLVFERRAGAGVSAEVALLRELLHPRVQLLLAIVGDGSDQLLVFEKLANGALSDYIRSHGADVGPKHLLNILIDALEGLQYLGSKGVLHRNLRLENVLLDERLAGKLGGMQLAACVSGGGGNDAPDVLVDEAAAAGLNVRHAAPEVLREARFSHKSDLWAAGVLVWQTLANGAVPLPELDEGAVKERALSAGGLSLPIQVECGGTEVCSKELHALLNAVWQAAPDARPTTSQLVDALYRELNEQYTTV